MMAGYPGDACIACGAEDFASGDVLWRDLINAWQLSEEEVAYINRQQGFSCRHCGNNLRSIGLAAAIIRSQSYTGTLSGFCESAPQLKVLEINAAGALTQFLQKIPGHRLIEYPAFDMTDLGIDSAEFDLVVHSDSLEHVQFPERALSECRRVLRIGGHCVFTVPLIVGRMTRSRHGLRPSYHGQGTTDEPDQRVHTEFGVDLWTSVLKAGFASCEMVGFEYPAAIPIVAKR